MRLQRLARSGLVSLSRQVIRFLGVPRIDRILGQLSGTSWRARRPGTGLACLAHNGKAAIAHSTLRMATSHHWFVVTVHGPRKYFKKWSRTLQTANAPILWLALRPTAHPSSPPLPSLLDDDVRIQLSDPIAGLYGLTSTSQVAWCFPSVEVKTTVAWAGTRCGSPAWMVILPSRG